MSDTIIVAILGAIFSAIFNAGALWATLRHVISRMERAEHVAERANDRIDGLTLRAGAGK